jgi:hypothetical protein
MGSLDLDYFLHPANILLAAYSIGSWTTAAPGEHLIEHGKPVETMSLLVRGKVQVTKGAADSRRAKAR